MRCKCFLTSSIFILCLLICRARIARRSSYVRIVFYRRIYYIGILNSISRIASYPYSIQNRVISMLAQIVIRSAYRTVNRYMIQLLKPRTVYLSINFKSASIISWWSHLIMLLVLELYINMWIYLTLYILRSFLTHFLFLDLLSYIIR